MNPEQPNKGGSQGHREASRDVSPAQRSGKKQANQSKKKRKHGCLTGLLIVGAVLAIVLAVVLKVFGDVNVAYDDIYQTVNKNKVRDEDVDLSQVKPISILLMGVDYGEEENRPKSSGGRADSLMILTLDPKNGNSTLTSIPRDVLTEIVGHGTLEKINHSYAYGESEMTINTVQHLFDIPIDYYVEVSMDGMKGIVDAIGGVEITSPLTFDFEGHHFNEGEKRTLNGDDALAFSRMRYTDPEGDYGRQKRQQMVIKAMMKKAVSMDSIANYQSVLDTLSENMRTNLSFDDLVDLQTKYRKAADHIERNNVYAHGMNTDGQDSIYVSKQEIYRVSNYIRKHLGIDEVSYDDITSNIYAPGLSEQFDPLDADETAEAGYPMYQIDENSNLILIGYQ